MNKDLLSIFEYLEHEKGIKREFIIEAIEEALLVSARKGQRGMGNVSVSINSKTGEISAIAEKEIVENVEYPAEEISLEEARTMDPDCQVGDWIDIDVDPAYFGRIAARVARQLISQKIRRAERDVIYEEYRDRIGDLISGTVKRVTRGQTLIIDLGKVEGILPGKFYPKLEKYHLGEKVLALLYDVQDTENEGAEVVLSRSHPDFVKALFYQEVPELSEGTTITIHKIVRDAGFRTKLAVSSSDIKVDPVGALVGVRGNRIKNIIRELNNEKIDIIPFSEDPITLLKNALAPAKIHKMEFNEEENTITLVINDEDYPAVLGKKGTNIRLTSELTGIQISAHKASDYEKALSVERRQLALSESTDLDDPIDKLEDVPKIVIDSLIAANLDTPRKLLQLNPSELAKETSISIEVANSILEAIRKQFNHLKT